MIGFFKRLAPTVVAIEAYKTSHHWARLLSSFSHEMKLIAPQLVKPYVKRGKNDAADAERPSCCSACGSGWWEHEASSQTRSAATGRSSG